MTRFDIVNKKHIIHIMPASFRGGGSLLIQNLVKALPKSCTSEVWVHKIIDSINYAPALLVEINHRSLLDCKNIYTRLKDLDKNETIIHVHGRHGFIIFAIAKFLNFKTIAHHHGYYYHSLNKSRLNIVQYLIDYFFLWCSSLVIFTSDGERDFALKTYSKKINFKVVYNRSFRDEIIFSRRRHSTNKRLVSMATANINQKGIDLQINLMKQLVTKFPKLKLIHYFNFAKTEELNFIRARISELNLEKNYIILQAHEDVWGKININTDILISCSRFEGRNLVIQEAFKAGLLVLATDCVGQAELLNEQRAFILPNNNYSNWVSVAQKAITIEASKCDKTDKAKIWIDTFGNIKDYAYEIEKQYENLINS